MIVGTCQIELIIFESNSLKEKRHVIKSIIERIKARFNVSVAEVDYLDLWNRSLIGVSVVSNSKILCDSTISKIIDFIDNDERVEIINHFMEVL
ncbi:uncharacterized protein YlxP (DUF503 family) [Sedimentibacter acidaminivorans]|jgi:uncharacterized protein|uniref:Uncharacterized protein YlxP (DUF503 family) n=1 Tax=Sedimentibacter acidaminivorans TaxID=913099 RepID=A0ABS4GCX7_9FIRM|nr:DUF503 domain-containing protein [Sedimentibacter acidaminivorans]MBP1925552.1 uncharacterized protein YlxP (DUF503 family) [Sedimentibacter acidaminivorans]